MKIHTMPKEVASELLKYIADTGDFSHTAAKTEIATEDIKKLLYEVALGLEEEVRLEKNRVKTDKVTHLSKETKSILSKLSTSEGEALFKAFGLLESQK